jgi:hypothetical protein
MSGNRSNSEKKIIFGPIDGQKQRIIDFKTDPDLMDLIDKIR